jgi:fumarylpyruvate hydrolase
MATDRETRAHHTGYSYAMNTLHVPQVSVAITDSDERFPVRRIFCIGRNYAAHAKEMGDDSNRGAPFYFTKAADAIVASGSAVRYPPRCEELHHEIELVVAIGKAGSNIQPATANEHIFGYAVGIDLTRRDLQAAAKSAGRPWDAAKNFDQSAPISEIHRVSAVGYPTSGRIWLSVNGEIRQDGNIDEMIWSVAESIAEISTYGALAEGDLVYTGTPAGVGPLVAGDTVQGAIEGVGNIAIDVQSA